MLIVEGADYALGFLPFLLPALIGGLASLGAGAMRSSAQQSANETNLQSVRETNAANAEINAQNIALQKEFAQSGIQWRTDDARAAGISPLAALGAQTMSFSPQSVGMVPGQVSPVDGMADGLANFGQDVSRGLEAARSHQERASAVAKTMQDLQLQRAGLENQLLATQIAKIRGAAVGPAMPAAAQRYLVDGQGEAAVVDLPLERVAPPLAVPSIEPGAVTDIGFTRTPTGWAPVMSKDAKERLEEDFIGGLTWNMRNRVLPSVSSDWFGQPPDIELKPGERWLYNPIKQEYQIWPR